MKLMKFTFVISVVVVLCVGAFLWSSSKDEELEGVYCGMFSVYTEGVLYSLKSSDIESAPETKSRLVSELRTTVGELERCHKMELENHQIIMKSRKLANEYLQNL
ncbi:hypothetical protein [Amphritea sp.]|uniref:hypothetical protein n=1 Tax=Amphritea sp. TaxID=1872502 RepID=UPI0025BDD06E|nr:hypothetical protein [Amphritea sp.]